MHAFASVSHCNKHLMLCVSVVKSSMGYMHSVYGVFGIGDTSLNSVHPSSCPLGS